MTVPVEPGDLLESDGIVAARIFRNLSEPALYEEAIRRGEGVIAADGPLVCRAGQHTGRSPSDKFLVREPSSERFIAWGPVNKAMEPAQFDALHHDIVASLTKFADEMRSELGDTLTGANGSAAREPARLQKQ